MKSFYKIQLFLTVCILFYNVVAKSADDTQNIQNTGLKTLEIDIEEEESYGYQPVEGDDGSSAGSYGYQPVEDDETYEPTPTPTYHVTGTPSLAPTGTEAPVTPPPTYRSRPTSHPSFFPTHYPTAAPTVSPTFAPTSRPSPMPISAPPTVEPTVNKALAELRYPKYFSSTADTVLLSLGIVVFVAWAAIAGLYAYRRYGWGGQFGEDRQHLVGTKAPKRKRIKKFEDYWDEESEDTTSRKFPTRAAASVNTFEDYWEESVDFSSHSSDALNFSRGL